MMVDPPDVLMISIGVGAERIVELAPKVGDAGLIGANVDAGISSSEGSGGGEGGKSPGLDGIWTDTLFREMLGIGGGGIFE